MTQKRPWFPFYCADYLADTIRLSVEQHGAYMLLLMDQWQNGPPPDDDGVLAHVTRMSVGKWRKIRPGLEPLFVISDGVWINKRMATEAERMRRQENPANAASRAADTNGGAG